MLGTYVLINSAISIAILSVVAMVTKQPFIFPSLGPTAFLLFYAATNVQAAPRSAFFGHLIGCWPDTRPWWSSGSPPPPPIWRTSPGTGWAPRPCLCASHCRSWSGSAFPMRQREPQPLIVSLGLLRTPEQLTVLMLAVVLLLVQGFLINRLAGLPYPVWAPRPQPE